MQRTHANDGKRRCAGTGADRDRASADGRRHYAPGDVLSIAYVRSGIGRLRCHDGRTVERNAATPSVPETISVGVLWDAPPYEAAQTLVLSFVDPSVARIHPLAPAAHGLNALTGEVGQLEPPLPETSVVDAKPKPDRERPDDASPLGAAPEGSSVPALGKAGVEVRFSWSADRVRRFVQVCDKLFTVERLGWYRHSLAVRLLVPDEIVCFDEAARTEAARHLEILRAAVAETLGNPLLAAFMPNFAVTPAWLASLDTPDVALALTGLRGVVAQHAADVSAALVPNDDAVTTGSLTRAELLATPMACVEAGLALLVPHLATHAALTEALGAYRAKLGELFAQMAESPEEGVRGS